MKTVSDRNSGDLDMGTPVNAVLPGRVLYRADGSEAQR